MGNNGPRLIKGKRAAKIIDRQRAKERTNDIATHGNNSLYVRIDEAKKRAAQLRQPATDDPFESFIQKIQSSAHTDDLIGKAYKDSSAGSYIDKKSRGSDSNVVSESQNISRLGKLLREGSKYAPEAIQSTSGATTVGADGKPGPAGSTEESRFAFFKENQAMQDQLLSSMGVSKKELDFKNDTYNTKKFMQGQFDRFSLGAAARSAGFSPKAAERDVIGNLTGMVDKDIVPEAGKKSKSDTESKSEKDEDDGGSWFGKKSFTDMLKGANKAIDDNPITNRIKDAALLPGGLLFGNKGVETGLSAITEGIDQISRPLYGVQNMRLEAAKLDDDNEGAGIASDKDQSVFQKVERAISGGWSMLDSVDEFDEMRKNGEDPGKLLWGAFKDGFSRKERTTTQDVIAYNAKRRSDSDSWMQSGIYQGGAGFAGDVVFDPISWVPGGAVAGLGKGAVKGTESVVKGAKKVPGVQRVAEARELKRTEQATKDWSDGKIDKFEYEQRVNPKQADKVRKNGIMETAKDLRNLDLTRKDFKGTYAERYFEENKVPSQSNVPDEEAGVWGYKDYAEKYNASPIDDTPVGIEDYAKMLGINASAKTHKSQATELRDIQNYTGALEGRVRQLGTERSVLPKKVKAIEDRISTINQSLNHFRGNLSREVAAEASVGAINGTKTVQAVQKAKDTITPENLTSFASKLLDDTESVDLDGLVSTHLGDSLEQAVPGAPIKVREAVDEVVSAFKSRSGNVASRNYFKDGKATPAWAKQKSQYEATMARVRESERSIPERQANLNAALASEDAAKVNTARTLLNKAQTSVAMGRQEASRILAHAMSSRFTAEVARATKIANKEDNVSSVFYAAPEGKVAALNALKSRALQELDKPSASLTGRETIEGNSLNDFGFDPDDFNEGMLESVWDNASGLDTHQYAENLIRMADNELKNLESPVGTPVSFTHEDLPATFTDQYGNLDPALKDFFQVRQGGTMFVNFKAMSDKLGRALTDYEEYAAKAIADHIQNSGFREGQKITGKDTRRVREEVTNNALSHMVNDMTANPTLYTQGQRKAAELFKKYFEYDKSTNSYAITVTFKDGSSIPLNKSGTDLTNLMRKNKMLSTADTNTAVVTKQRIKRLYDFQHKGGKGLSVDEAKRLHSALAITSQQWFPDQATFVNLATNRQPKGAGGWLWNYLDNNASAINGPSPYMPSIHPGNISYARNAQEAGTSLAHLQDAKRLIMWGSTRGVSKADAKRLRHTAPNFKRAKELAKAETTPEGTSVLDKSLQNIVDVQKGTYEDRIMAARDLVFRKPETLNHDYPKLIKVNRPVGEADGKVSLQEDIVSAPKPPVTPTQINNAQMQALATRQKAMSEMLDKSIKELQAYEMLDDDGKRSLARLLIERDELKDLHTTETARLKDMQAKATTAKRAMDRLMDDANLMRVASMHVTNPNLRGPLSNWASEGLLETPGFSAVINGFERMNSPEFLQRMANASGKSRNPFADSFGGRARFTNLYTKAFGSNANMNSEFQLMNARFMGQTPKIVEHHLNRLKKNVQTIKPSVRKDALMQARHQSDEALSPEAKIIADEFDRLVPYFTGQIYPDMTVDDVMRFVPKELISSQRISSMVREGTINRGTIARLVSNGEDPLESLWRLNIAVEQGVAYASLKSDIKNYGVQLKAVSEHADGTPYFSQSQKRSIKASNTNKQYPKHDSATQAKAINKLKSKGWGTIEGIDGHLFPPEVLPEVKRLLSMTDPREFNKFEKLVDGATRTWKAALTVYNPSYYTTNFYGEIMAGWLGGVDNPVRYSQAAGVLKYANRNKDYEAFISKNGWESHMKKPESGGKSLFMRDGRNITQEDIAVLYKDMGLDTGFINTEVGANMNNVKPGNRFNVVGKAHNRIRGLGATAEDWPRVAHFIDAMDKAPKNLNVREAAEYAAEMVRKYHFDYSDLSNFEKTVMTRVFPFYTFTRKVLPLYAKMMFQKPKRFTAMQKIYANASMASGPLEGGEEMDGLLYPNYEDQDSSEWVREAGFIPMGDHGVFKPQDPISIARNRVNNGEYMAQIMANPLLKVANQLPKGPEATGKEIAGIFPQVDIAKDAGLIGDEENQTKLANSALGSGWYKDPKYKDFTRKEIDPTKVQEFVRNLLNGK